MPGVGPMRGHCRVQQLHRNSVFACFWCGLHQSLMWVFAASRTCSHGCSFVFWPDEVWFSEVTCAYLFRVWYFLKRCSLKLMRCCNGNDFRHVEVTAAPSNMRWYDLLSSNLYFVFWIAFAMYITNTMLLLSTWDIPWISHGISHGISQSMSWDILWVMSVEFSTGYPWNMPRQLQFCFENIRIRGCMIPRNTTSETGMPIRVAKKEVGPVRVRETTTIQ